VSVGDALGRFGLVAALLLVIALFTLLLPGNYLNWLNLETIAANQATTLMLALAILLPLIAGEFDLSIAANFGFCQLLMAGLMIDQGLPWGVAILVTALAGGVVGLVNGVLIVVLRINSFIATLGMATILAGFTTWYSDGRIIVGDMAEGFLKLGQTRLFGELSIAVVYAVALAVILWIGVTYVASGRHLYATGGGRTAAVLLGIRTSRLIIASFVIGGVIAALTGVITTSQLGSGQPELGPSYLLPAYAGAFLGATTIIPGQFNVWGTVIGVYLLGAGVSGLQKLGIPPYVQDFFNGGALLLAVAASGYLTRRRLSGPLGKGRRRPKSKPPSPPPDVTPEGVEPAVQR